MSINKPKGIVSTLSKSALVALGISISSLISACGGGGGSPNTTGTTKEQPTNNGEQPSDGGNTTTDIPANIQGVIGGDYFEVNGVSKPEIPTPFYGPQSIDWSHPSVVALQNKGFNFSYKEGTAEFGGSIVIDTTHVATHLMNELVDVTSSGKKTFYISIGGIYYEVSFTFNAIDSQPVLSGNFSPRSYTASQIGTTFNIGASVSDPDINDTNPVIWYSSSNDTVASVDNSGNVVIQGVGSTTITVIGVSNGLRVSKTLSVSVEANLPATTLTGWVGTTPNAMGNAYTGLVMAFNNTLTTASVASAGGTISGITVNGNKVTFNYTTPVAANDTLTFTGKDSAGRNYTLTKGVSLGI